MKTNSQICENNFVNVPLENFKKLDCHSIFAKINKQISSRFVYPQLTQTNTSRCVKTSSVAFSVTSRSGKTYFFFFLVICEALNQNSNKILQHLWGINLMGSVLRVNINWFIHQVTTQFRLKLSLASDVRVVRANTFHDKFEVLIYSYRSAYVCIWQQWSALHTQWLAC